MWNNCSWREVCLWFDYWGVCHYCFVRNFSSWQAGRCPQYSGKGSCHFITIRKREKKVFEKFFFVSIVWWSATKCSQVDLKGVGFSSSFSFLWINDKVLQTSVIFVFLVVEKVAELTHGFIVVHIKWGSSLGICLCIEPEYLTRDVNWKNCSTLSS